MAQWLLAQYHSENSHQQQSKTTSYISFHSHARVVNAYTVITLPKDELQSNWEYCFKKN